VGFWQHLCTTLQNIPAKNSLFKQEKKKRSAKTYYCQYIHRHCSQIKIERKVVATVEVKAKVFVSTFSVLNMYKQNKIIHWMTNTRNMNDKWWNITWQNIFYNFFAILKINPQYVLNCSVFFPKIQYLKQEKMAFWTINFSDRCKSLRADWYIW